MNYQYHQPAPPLRAAGPIQFPAPNKRTARRWAFRYYWGSGYVRRLEGYRMVLLHLGAGQYRATLRWVLIATLIGASALPGFPQHHQPAGRPPSTLSHTLSGTSFGHPVITATIIWTNKEIGQPVVISRAPPAKAGTPNLDFTDGLFAGVLLGLALCLVILLWYARQQTRALRAEEARAQAEAARRARLAETVEADRDARSANTPLLGGAVHPNNGRLP